MLKKLAGMLLIVFCCIARAQQTEPGGTDADRSLALTNADEYAWRLFMYLNRQAAAGAAGVPDASKPSIANYDDDRDAIWETWALSSGLDLDTSVRPFKILANYSEVFKNPATMPAKWEDLPRGTNRPKILSEDFKGLLTLLEPAGLRSPGPGGFRILIAPIGSNPAEDESRMNKSTYETVRSQGLFSVEGIEAAASKAATLHQNSLVTFEQGSKEVKARWIHLADCDNNPSCADKKRYHWRTVPRNGVSEIWGLVSLHIITKDLPNWFWADFGHIDCDEGKGACAAFRAETPLRDSTTLNSGGVRKGTENTKWSFYRLRGTETDFVTSNGIDAVLSNPVIEAGFQRSSCLTCHSYATSAASAAAPAQGTSLPLFAGKTGVRNAGSHSDDIGKSDCRRFYSPGGGLTQQCGNIFSPGNPLYVQTDFLWSIAMRAFSAKP